MNTITVITVTIYLMQALGIGLATQAGGAAIGAGLGLLTTYLGNGMQLSQNQQLLNQQTAYNENLSNYNLGLQEKLWNDTNYPAQVQQMNDAGINPAMMFAKGMSAGGTTMANTVATSQPAVQQNPALNIESMMSAGQRAAAQAAMTNKTVADISNVNANTQLQSDQDVVVKNQQVITKAEAEIKDSTIQDSVQIVRASLQSIINDNVISVAKGYVDKLTADTRVAQAKQDLLNAGVQNILMNSQIGLTNAEKQETLAAINQRWKEISISKQNADTNAKNASTNWINAMTNIDNNIVSEYNADTQRQQLLLNKFINNMSATDKAGFEMLMGSIGIAGTIAGKAAGKATYNTNIYNGEN